MPTYVYEVVLPDGSAGERFEVIQRMSDPILTTHPETGEPVRKVITAAYFSGKWSDAAAKRTINDDKRLGELGFTKYVKSSKGTYEKRAGDGPDLISAD
ncbi:Zinc ribbon domain protein [Gimesia algae]|uniref:Zinc ribbon domain protein n=2 Tax=Gimesia algae TaxID=2527971 RepID=A0A517VED1_9PLAN|nr:Zinc ribbon domain protein [Gimesia algae]